MAEFGELASAFVRVRPDLAGFRSELQAGIKNSFREIGTLHVPGLQGAKNDFASVVASARRSGVAVTQANESAVASTKRRSSALADVATQAKLTADQEIAAGRRATLEHNRQLFLARADAQKAARLSIQGSGMTHSSAERKAAGLPTAKGTFNLADPADLERLKAQFRGVATTAKQSAGQINQSSASIVESARARTAALLETAESAKVGSVEQRQAYQAAARVAVETSAQIELAERKTGKTALLGAATEQQAARHRVEAALSVAAANRDGSAAQIAALERAAAATRALAGITTQAAGSVVESNVAVGSSAKLASTEVVESIRRIRTAREQEVRDAVAAGIAERRSLAETLVAYRELAAGAVRGSATQIEANRLAAESAARLGLKPTPTERKAVGALGGGQDINRLERGALAGSGAFRGLGRSVAFASLSFIGAYGFINTVRGAIEEAGDLNNQITRSKTIFGDSAGDAQKWAADTGRALDFAKSTALGAVDTFGTLFNAVGLGQKQSAAFAEDVTKIAAAASLAAGEADPSKAFDAFRTGLSGRVTYALRQYGIVLDQTLLKSKAIQLGLVPTTADPTKVALAQRRLLEATAAFQEAKIKGSPLDQAKAEDAVSLAQARLRKEVQGTTGELSQQAKAVAAHALIVEQGAKFVDRYRTSLHTSAGESRSFHEGIKELKEELGGALYPSFAQTVRGIIGYTHSLEEGGSRHEQFKQDLHDVATAGKDFLLILRSLGKGFDVLSTAVGGVGNLVEILGLIYATNKMLTLAHAIRESRLALILLGETAPTTATAVIGAEAEMAAGAQTLGARMSAAKVQTLELLGGLGRLAKVGTIAIAVDLLINKDDRQRAIDLLRGGSGESKTARTLLDIGTLGGHEVLRHFFGKKGSGESPTDLADLLDNSVTRIKHSINSLSDIKVDSKITVSSVEKSLGTIAGEIDKGGKLTKAHANLLAAELTSIIASIAESGFGTSTKQKLVGKANELAIALATSTDQIGKKTIDSLIKSRAEIRQQLGKIGDDIAQARADMQTAISDAITSASQAERDAVQQAKANLNTLGASLADFINRFVDAQQAKAQKAPTGPLAARLKELTDLIHAGQGTPEIIAKAKEVEAEINAQQAKGDDTSKRKERITRRLSDLTDELNTGKIGIAKFNREVTALLRHEGINYRNAGRVLGVAFADGFKVALAEIREQAQAINKTPAKLRGTSTGLETQIVRPLEVIREQNRNIARVEDENHRKLRDLIAKRHELLLKEQTKSNEIAKLQRARMIEIAKSQAGLRQITKQAKEKDEVKPRAVPPAELEKLRRAHDQQFKVNARGDVNQIGNELERIRKFVLRNARVFATIRLAVARSDETHATALAREGGRQVGRSFADGIQSGAEARERQLARTAAKVILNMVRAAKFAGKIKSPSEITRDEIGNPLIEGVEVALEGAGARLGATLAAQITEAVHRGRLPAAGREIEAQGRRAAGHELEHAVRGTPAASSILDREAIKRATGHPGAVGGILHRGEVAAISQRNLLLNEERKQTRLLETIVSEEKKQTVLLRERGPHVKVAHVNKNPRVATREATATAIHNLLGS